ncbi:MAG: bifunctional pyr operon transcriptional regulator/uracil phosphoribosyltransferase PyrR [Bacteroidota bacterium]
MSSRQILTPRNFAITIDRLCYQLIENHGDFSNSVIIGLQPRGVYLSNRIANRLNHLLGGKPVVNGNLDITFFRDDFRRREQVIVPSSTDIDFVVENKKVILTDDVLYTGRSVRAAMDALQSFGRPLKVELLALIDRKFSREIPIEPTYVGKAIDSIMSEKVRVLWSEVDGTDEVWLNSREVTA